VKSTAAQKKIYADAKIQERHISLSAVISELLPLKQTEFYLIIGVYWFLIAVH
jgi:hypothetical protein